MRRRKLIDQAKRHGIHYTPPELAAFLADAILSASLPCTGPLSVLDPACGDGGLLPAFAQAMANKARKDLTLVGFETDFEALAEARCRLRSVATKEVILEQHDFLTSEVREYDAVIANPPYVRTQTLGALRARQLAKQLAD